MPRPTSAPPFPGFSFSLPPNARRRRLIRGGGVEMALRLHFLLFSLLLFPAAAQHSPFFPDGGGDDVRSLLEFKKGIRDDPSGLVLQSWDPSSALGPGRCPDSWYGVACGGDGAVVAVALDGLGLSGDLKFSTLTGITSLRNLSLSGNNFTGRLVPAVGSMASLKHLDLSGNQFYGPIPGRITELWGLLHLNLSSNGFTGGLPSGIRNLQQLRALDLRSNGLWGDVRDVMSELRNVEHLDLSGNAFYGGLSMDSANLSSFANTAKLVNLSRNNLNGGFFTSDSLRLLKNLEILDVSDNQLSGQLPSLDFLSNLRVLRARNNQLYGSLPQELLGSSMALVELDLSGNMFTGPVFNINSTSLKILNLSSNALSGSLPSDIGSCNTLDLSGNMISGNLSHMQSWRAMLEVVDLSSNMLLGNLPNLTFLFEVLTSINMKNNSLFGVLPSMLGSYPRLSVVDLSMNNMTGPLLPSFFSSLTLTYLNLSRNHFRGPIPFQSSHSCESVLPSISHMEFLDLSDNSLSGPLSPEIVEMQKLKLLNLGKNSFSGEIPSEIGKLNGLEVLDLAMNHFKGDIPDMPQVNLRIFNISYNDLSGLVPESLRKFPDDSFHPGNILLVLPDGMSASAPQSGFGFIDEAQHHHLKYGIQVAIIVGSVGALVLLFFIFMAVYRIRTQTFCGRNGFRGHDSGKDVQLGIFASPNISRPHKNDDVPHLFISAAFEMPAQKDSVTETVESGFSDSREVSSETPSHGVQDSCASHEGCMPSHGSTLTSSAHFLDAHPTDQSVVLDVYSPDRLAGELFFLDNSLVFTIEDLSCAPAEVIGRSSHGTSYKASLNTGHVLAVKWLKVGFVRHKKEFAKEVKRIGSIRHPNIIPWTGYYWGAREQERIILSDYVYGDSLALHLHEGTPRRHSPLSCSQRLKIAFDIARCLYHLHHDRGLPHGNLKPANVLLKGPDRTAKLTDYCLHRLMTPSGTAEQMLNLGALGYGAPEVATASKPFPSFEADVYAFGVIMMELLTGRCAGDIISGQSGAVDLTDWVRKQVREGWGVECFDRNIIGSDEEPPKAMEELLAVSLQCILPVNERPNIRTIFADLRSITV